MAEVETRAMCRAFVEVAKAISAPGAVQYLSREVARVYAEALEAQTELEAWRNRMLNWLLDRTSLDVPELKQLLSEFHDALKHLEAIQPGDG